MRLLIYEWCCSGGLAGPDARAIVRDGDDVESLAREGRAMFAAVLADAVRDGAFEVTAVVDASRAVGVPAGVRVRRVPAGGECAALVEESQAAEATLVVAPETAGILAARVACVREAGGTVLSPGAGFIGIAADKQATIDALAAAGVPVPAGRSLAAGEPWPPWFRQPAVRKARASTGCDELLVVRRDDPLPSPAAVSTRLEAWAEGMPVGVSCLMGPAGIRALPALRQRFTAGATVRYLGGEPIIERGRRARSEAVAVRAIDAVARVAGDAVQAGWVGVDMILGARDDGLDDRVLEINPRLTTSFVGLSRSGGPSLVRAIVEAATGRPPRDPHAWSAAAFMLDEDEPSLRVPT